MSPSGLTHLFLDLDGVFADFIGSALRVHGLAIDAYKVKTSGGFLRVEDAIGISSEDFWRPIDELGERFWSNIEPYPWAGRLRDELRAVTEPCDVRTIVATHPVPHPGCYAGKAAWVYRHFGPQQKAQIGPDKHLLGKPGRALIDDSDDVLSLFEAEGGLSVRFCQPWNSGHQYGGDPVALVVETVERLCRT